MTPVTVRIPLVGVPPSATSTPWPAVFDPALGRTPLLAWLVLLMTVVTGAFGWYWSRTAREPEPGLPAMYAPPRGLGPVQTV